MNDGSSAVLLSVVVWKSIAAGGVDGALKSSHHFSHRGVMIGFRLLTSIPPLHPITLALLSLRAQNNTLLISLAL